MSPFASICSLSMMEMGSRGGAPGAEVELSNQGTPCFLNTLDTPCQEEALLTCATPTEHRSLGLQLLMQSRHILAAV